MLKMLPEWLWPRLQPLSIAMQIDQAERIKTRRDKITTEQWVKSADVALEEARRLFDAEQDRRRGADSKAAVYLAVITALIPVLAAVLPAYGRKVIIFILVYCCFSLPPRLFTCFALASGLLKRSGYLVFLKWIL